MERKWAASHIEKYAEKWFTENGFKFELVKQYMSKTVYDVHKNGITDRFHLPNEVTDPKGYMELFNKSFELLEKLEKRKKELGLD